MFVLLLLVLMRKGLSILLFVLYHALLLFHLCAPPYYLAMAKQKQVIGKLKFWTNRMMVQQLKFQAPKGVEVTKITVIRVFEERIIIPCYIT